MCPGWVALLTHLLINLLICLVLFQCRASVADGCPPLNQPCMFTMVSSNLYVLDLTIEITVVIPANAQCRFNIILMLGQHRIQ